MTDLFSVEDKTIIVTGGLGQLGRQFALALADRRARVAILDSDVSDKRIAERFGARASDSHLMFIATDVTRRNSLESALRQVETAWGAPHGLVNNAGLDAPPNAPAGENGPFETYPESSWDKVMEVNVKGVLLCCQVIGGRMASA